MIHRLLAATVLALASLQLTSTASALEFPSLLNGSNPFSEISDSSNRPEHAGLLGKMYLEARYVHIQTEEAIIQPFDDTYQGVDATFNMPMSWLTELAPSIGADIFFSFQHLQIGGTTGGYTLDMDVNSYAAGVSVYAAAFGPIRPFVQLGVQHDVIDLFAANPQVVATVSISQNDTYLLSIVGLEADVAENTSVRLAIDINEQAFDAPPITADLIIWPAEQFYLRAGVFATTDGNEVGGLFGGGIVF